MSALETITTPSIFVDEYDDERMEEITAYTHDIASQLQLPHQEDAWGCVSASGAFIINYAYSEDVTDAAQLDEAMVENRTNPVTPLSYRYSF